ncbi:MAG: Hypothetical protein BHV28_13020 [Candidatus Tokpelaia hoelldobleri]|uniref:DUF2853 family protein n=1 Tax=Candidatus Tokpelaia hoelldobleri TaxID=1902579 RepID=A0A1U9JVW2_9HYPH|nr:MAG: Hypothetical protein BHV28_13020 [Candidatus Tokpelaia hoelldoblerii]
MSYPTYDLEKCLADIERFDSHPDRGAVERLTHYLLPTIQNHDAQFVATSEEQEVTYVEEKWAQDRLGASASAAHEAVAHVARQMKDTHNKSRITFYYLVAKKLGKLGAIPG